MNEPWNHIYLPLAPTGQQPRQTPNQHFHQKPTHCEARAQMHYDFDLVDDIYDNKHNSLPKAASRQRKEQK